MPEEATHSPHIRASAPESSVRKPILAVDFDGTLHAYTSGWKGADIVSDPHQRCHAISDRRVREV